MNLKTKLAWLMSASLLTASVSAIGGTELQQLQSGHIDTVKISTTMGNDLYNEAQIAAKSVTMADLANEAKKHELNEQQTKDALYNSIFPVHTPTMTVSHSIPYKMFTTDHPFVPNLAIVGSDQYSINWLKANKQKITSSRAVTILVEANNDQDYQRVLQAADGLEVIPVPATDITKQFGIKNYPVLMSKLGYGQ